MSARGWHRFFPEAGGSGSEPVLDALNKCGVDLSAPARGCTPGVVFFSAFPNELAAFLSEQAQRTVRTLAVYLGEAPLPGAACWNILEAGASDVLWWNGSRHPALDIHDRLARWEQVESDLRSPVVREHLIGESRPWIAVLRELIELARYASSSCLLQGESGTGKELAARLIHTLDPRPDKKELVVADCSTIVPELSGSEFFGHERGAFTGAVGSRDGAFAMADGGTLFLDEAGELPLPLQAQLLRVIQEGTYKRVGGNDWRKTNFRLIAATNRDLASEVAQGRFRADLFYRISGAVVTLPPLRQRRADILPLVESFSRRLLGEEATGGMDPVVNAHLLKRDYPGNVRELRQIVERMCRRHAGPGPLTPGDLPMEDRPPAAAGDGDWCGESFRNSIRVAVLEGVGLKEIGRQATDCAISMALESCDGNVRMAAERLGVTDRTLQIRRAVQREREARRRPGPPANAAS